MPNWVENDLTVNGPADEVRRFMEAVRADKPEGDEKEPAALDANKLIPMPPELHDTPSGPGSIPYDALYGTEEDVKRILAYPWVKPDAAKSGPLTREDLVAFLEKEQPDEMKLGRRLKENKDKYGYTDWYRWALANWGTKWGFCEVRVEGPEPLDDDRLEVVYHFDTAWSPPDPLIDKMGELFPKLHFLLEYFECGVGFQGTREYEEGELVSEDSRPYAGDRGG